MMGNILNAGIGENFAVDIQRGAFALAGLSFDLAREFLVYGDVANFKRDGEFVEEPDDRGGPRAATLAINDHFHDRSKCHIPLSKTTFSHRFCPPITIGKRATMDLRRILKWSQVNTPGSSQEPKMTLQGISAKVALLTLCFFVGAMFGWGHFSKRAEKVKSNFPQMQRTLTVSARSAEKPVEQMTSEEKVEYVRGTVPSWTRGINYPIFAWLLFLLSVGLLFFPSDTAVKWLAPICVVLEGVAMGSLEVLLHERYPGATLVSLLLTTGLLLTCAIVLWSGVLDDHRLPMVIGVGIAGSLVFTWIATFVLSSFGYPVPFFNEKLGYWFSAAAVTTGINTFIVVMWWKAIRDDLQKGVPQVMEWRAALRVFVEFVYLIRRLRSVARRSR
jgi:hypothetical protein